LDNIETRYDMCIVSMCKLLSAMLPCGPIVYSDWLWLYISRYMEREFCCKIVKIFICRGTVYITAKSNETLVGNSSAISLVAALVQSREILLT
jgi:hypothetical protein